MHLYRYLARDGRDAVAVRTGDQLSPLQFLSGHVNSLAELLDAEDRLQMIDFLKDDSLAVPLAEATLLPPIDQQEVWAAGVTYKRSKTARMEESTTAASCYDRVYQSPRPELFFKATPHRVVGHQGHLRIRRDSTWNVPEPELTLVLNRRAELVGFTIGNDMSSRDIEGQNPLYLPQAKVYDQCCALGPCITLPDSMPPRSAIGIRMEVARDGETIYAGETGITEMARSFEDLIGWLTRDSSFPHGAFLLTGTGIVPDSSFSLQPRDVVHIDIDGIGRLSNPIIQD